jgi:hypothetical protein
LSLKSVLNTAFDDLAMFVEFDDPRRDFIIAKILLQKGVADVCGPLLMYMDSIGFDDEEGNPNNFAKSFITHSLDVDIMRFAMSLDDIEGDMNLKETALILVNNSIFALSSRLPTMTVDEPLFELSMECASRFTEHIPDEWPGVDGSYAWGSDKVDRESIKQYWIDEPDLLQMWRLAIFKLLKWVHEVEEGGHIFEYLLRSKDIYAGMTMHRQQFPINNFSFGPFLVMKAVEYGGAVSLSVKLRTQDDFTTFFSDYYDYLHVYSGGFPTLIRYMERVLAKHHSIMG